MDIRQVIDAHVEWKRRFTAYLTSPDQSLDEGLVAQLDQCQLGRWLYDEGQQYSDWSGFAQLICDHERFHRAAAGLLKRADAGECVAGEAALDARSEYAKASNAVITALTRLRVRGKPATGMRAAEWRFHADDSHLQDALPLSSTLAPEGRSATTTARDGRAAN
jgi:hypothetical protein